MRLMINEPQSSTTITDKDLTCADVHAQDININLEENPFFQFNNAKIESTTGKITIQGLDVTHRPFKSYLDAIGVTVTVDRHSKKVTLQGADKSIVLTPFEIAKLNEFKVVPARRVLFKLTNSPNNNNLGDEIVVGPGVKFNFEILGLGHSLYRIEKGDFTLNGVSVRQADCKAYLESRGIAVKVDETPEGRLLIVAVNNQILSKKLMPNPAVLPAPAAPLLHQFNNSSSLQTNHSTSVPTTPTLTSLKF